MTNTPARREQITTHEIPYALIRRGASSAIADEHGMPISDWFGNFEVFESQEESGRVSVRGLIGQIGAMKYVVGLPTEEEPRFVTATKGYHDIEYRFDLGAFAGKIGAMTCLLDETGREITAGFHQIFVEDDVVYGKIGGLTEALFQINPELPPETE